MDKKLNLKSQILNPKQILNAKFQTFNSDYCLCLCDLNIVWCLVLGIWNFTQRVDYA